MFPAELEHLIGGKPRIALDDLVRHPRLPQARQLYIDRFLDLYGSDPFLVRLLIETGRFMVYHLSIVLDAAQQPDRRETWLTVGLLKEKMAAFGPASSRHIDHLISRLCAVGLMRKRAAAGDRRVRLIEPTEELRAHDRAWLVAHYSPLTVLYPEHDYGLILRQDPDFHVLYRQVSNDFVALGAALYMAEPDMLLFLGRAAGYPILAALLQSAMRHPGGPEMGVSYTDIGDRFGVSRTHVRKLLQDAEAAGLVQIEGRGGRRVMLLPRLWESHDRGIAAGMYLHDILYVAASRALPVP